MKTLEILEPKAGTMPAETTSDAGIPCFPILLNEKCCDILQFKRILNYPVNVRVNEKLTALTVQIILHFKFSRCNEGLLLGDPVYSTTLLPGEKVKLQTTDRRSRFSYDSETKLSYRSEQISEEQYFMTALQHYVTDGANSQGGNATHSDSGDWNFHGDVKGSYSTYVVGGSADASVNSNGKHNSKSVLDYLNEQKSHSQGSASQAVGAVHKAHSVSIGEVSTKTHVQGESEDHFESSSREFSNPNHCHAINFIFYRINKKQVVKFELLDIEKRVLDPVAPVRRDFTPQNIKSAVAVIPQDVPATSKLFVNRDLLLAGVNQNANGFNVVNAFGQNTFQNSAGEPISPELRNLAIQEVNKQLALEGLVDEKGNTSDKIKQQISFETMSCLPTAGVIVKGSLDNCDVCEPEVHERIQLQNDLLRKQIELLEKSQEYRCCPAVNDNK